MAFYIKKIVKYLLILIILALIGLVIFIFTFDLNNYKDVITEKASAALSRPVQINSVKLKASLIPTISVNGITIENPQGLDPDKPFLKVQSMDATLALIPLLSGNIDIKEFLLGPTTINLIEKDGKNNWQFSGESAPKATKRTGSSQKSGSDVLSNFKIENISIKNLKLFYIKDEKVVQNLGASDFSMKQLSVFSGTFYYQGYMFTASGVFNNVLDFINQKPNYLFNLDMSGYGTTAKLSGSIADTKKIGGISIEANVFAQNINNTLRLALKKEMSVPALPFQFKTSVTGDLDTLNVRNIQASLGRDQFVLTANLTLQNMKTLPMISLKGNAEMKDGDFSKSLKIKPFVMTFALQGNEKELDVESLSIAANKSDMSFNGTLWLADKPVITGVLSSDYLKLADFIYIAETQTDNQPVGTKVKVSKEGALFPDDTIDLSALNDVNATLKYAFKNIKIPSDFGNYFSLNGKASLENGVLALMPQIGIADGSVGGTIEVRAQKKASLSADLTLRDLKTDAVKVFSEQLKGSIVDGKVSLKTSGTSVKSYMENLSGNLEMEISEGTILNKWFNSLPETVGLVQKRQSAFSYAGGTQEDKLVCAGMNIGVDGGIVQINDNIALETSMINFVLSGNVNLKDETLSVSMLPSINAASDKLNKALVLTQSIKIAGPITSPKPSLDMASASKDIAKNVLEEVIENRLEKKNAVATEVIGALTKINKSASKEKYVLCEAALGHPLKRREKTEATGTAPQKTSTVKQAIQKEADTAEQFKKQLMDSLSRAVKKKK
ncbi:MAG: AsmA family protein [Lactobacillales bacterium]|jgi:uncharacterized protein involved in outer membrane biogenesis|nr:AsmA family protein [Lactobacillales bacterium]